MGRTIVLCVCIVCFIAGVPVLGQPSADFTVDIEEGCVPLKVSFSDLSSNAVSWEWELGPSVSSSQNPIFVFVEAGTYTIKLTVTDAQGNKDEHIKTAYIKAYAPPSAIPSVNSFNVCKDAPLTFSDESVKGSGEIVFWEWNFGDGAKSTQASPTHAYQSASSYPVSLYVEDEFGCSSEEPLDQVIAVNAPDAQFGIDNPGACTPPLNVIFSSTSEPDEDHYWDFGDGTFGTTPNPFHTYSFIGNYDVWHRIIDTYGCKDSVFFSKAINIGGGSFFQFTSFDTTICLGSPSFFSTNAASNSTVTWDFGDGNSSNDLTASHTYTNPGTYTVTVNVLDAGGCTGSLTQTVNVYTYPTVDFMVDGATNSCDVPFDVEFRDLSTGVTSWYWILGDGQTSTEQHPSITYTTEDSFRVILVGTGPGGCLRTEIKEKYIITQKNSGDFFADVRSGCAPLDVQFGDNLVSLSAITDFEWDFGDGNTSSQRSPSHTYSNAGDYTVQLVLTNIENCKDTLTKVNYIAAGSDPALGISLEKDSVCAWEPITITNLSPNGNYFQWEFGDGEYGSGRNPTHIFQDLGWMDLTLIGAYNGCYDTLQLDDYLYVLGPLPQIEVDKTQYCELPAMVNMEGTAIGAPFFTWDFGNGNQGTGNQVTTYFIEEGTYIVTLTSESDSTGCKVTAEETIEVYEVGSRVVADTTRGCAPLQVQFMDSSKNVASREWIFEGGSSTSEPNPLITYTQAGSYDVTLITTNQLGCSDTLLLADYIQVEELHAAMYTPPIVEGCVTLPIQFRDSSHGSGTITSWFWDFGDQDSSQVQSPLHNYEEEGFFTVQLIVADDKGCVDTLTNEDMIHATLPTASFATNYPENCPGNPISFFNLSTGKGLSYTWDLGDGTTTTDINPIHTYTSEGFYDISLTVVDENGCNHYVERLDYIHIAALPDDFTPDSTTIECPPLIANFEPNRPLFLSDADVTWQFGDGTNSTDYYTAARYTQAGIFDVSLTIISPSGCTVFLEKEDLIEVGGPVGSFTFSPDTICPGESVHFASTAEVEVEYEWIFGDGNLSNEDTLDHVYVDPGIFVPVLVITDSINCSSYIPALRDLVVRTPPQVALRADDSLLCNSGTVLFNTEIIAGEPATAWEWDVGNGYQVGADSEQASYSAVGTYDIGIITFDNLGCSDTVLFQNFIEVVQGPQATITISDSTGCAPLLTAFGASTTGSIIAWEWDFGDGDTALTPSPIHQFYQEGGFLTQLTVRDTNDCRFTAQQNIEIWPLPNPDFIVSPDSLGCAPITLDFMGKSNSADTWLWDFGDGNTSSTQNPTHTYLTNDSFTVSLLVTNTYNCSDTLSKTQYIRLSAPIANFQLADSLACPDSSFVFKQTSQSDTLITGWLWDFGDGITSTDTNPSHAYSQVGHYPVQLIVEDIFGCRDTLRKDSAALVLDQVVPEALDILGVSISEENEISINYSAFENNRGDFGSYVFYRSVNGGNFEEIANVTEVAQTTFVDTNLDLQGNTFCYKMAVENICRVQPDISSAQEHCPIKLFALPANDAIELSWEPYVGWNRTRGYTVFRVVNYDLGSAVPIASLPPSQTTYTDSTICYDPVSYRVMATADFGPVNTYSNIVQEAPIHFGPTESAELSFVSVESNAAVKVEWTIPNLAGLDSIIIERIDGQGQSIFFKEDGKTSKIQDQQADVQSQSYAYVLFAKDSCGDQTPIGRTHRTMHLQTRQENGTVLVSWNSYEGWEKGVERYQVELYDMNTNSYQVLGDVPGNVTTFTDDQSNVAQAANCYRVVALEAQGNGTLSISNENCRSLESVLYSANAFSPNGDGVNDRFTLQSPFLGAFEMSIYNRFGNLVFYSQDGSIGWDGTNSRTGSAVAPGVYLYMVKGTQVNGEPFTQGGSITVLQ